MSNQPRVQKGVPAGGQWTATERSDSGVGLAPTRAFPDTPTAFTQRYDSVEEKVAACRQELEQAVAALAEDDNWLTYLDTMSRFHRYSPTNQLLIAIQTKGRARQVAGFRAWQKKFGRTVNKGEKGITIFAPRTIRATVKDKNGDPVMGKDGKPLKRPQLVGFTTATVFDVSQTSGDPLPDIERERTDEPPEGFIDDMVAAAQAAGFEVEFRPMDSLAKGGAQGWVSPTDKQVVIDSDLSPGSQAATLAHELGHIYAGHTEPDKASQYHIGSCRGRFEVEAESVAWALTRINGMSMDESKVSATYVAGWSQHNPEALRESADTVSRAVSKIVESTDFRNLA